MRHSHRLAFISLLALAAMTAQAWQVRDDLGAVVTGEASPKRVVSVLPSLTEMVCDLGQCNRLVGVDRYSDWPLSVKRLPLVGGGIDPSIEAIVALKPDLVLMSPASRGAQRLRDLGLTVLTLEPKQYADIEQTLNILGVVFGLPSRQSEQLWQHIESEVAKVAASLPASVKGARVYFEVSPAPYAVGEHSFMGETLTRLGVQNIVPAALGPFPKLNPEFVVRANPDVIMVSSQAGDRMEDRPGWKNLKAVRDKRVCIFTSEQSNVLTRPSPRIAEAAKLMADCLAKK